MNWDLHLKMNEMANNYDNGMDDAYCGKEPSRDATIEYLIGYGRAEELCYPQQQHPEQVDDIVQEDPREEELPSCESCIYFSSAKQCNSCNCNKSEYLPTSPY